MRRAYANIASKARAFMSFKIESLFQCSCEHIQLKGLSYWDLENPDVRVSMKLAAVTVPVEWFCGAARVAL